MGPFAAFDWLSVILILLIVGIVGVGGYGVFLIFRALRKYTSRDKGSQTPQAVGLEP